MCPQVFFLFILMAFLFAGSIFRENGGWMGVRWLVLGVGAMAGFAITLKDRGQSFRAVPRDFIVHSYDCARISLGFAILQFCLPKGFQTVIAVSL